MATIPAPFVYMLKHFFANYGSPTATTADHTTLNNQAGPLRNVGLLWSFNATSTLVVKSRSNSVKFIILS